MQKTIDQIIKRVNEENSFFLFCHVSPDGDALGSALGLSFALKSLGKRVRVFCADPPPERLMFLPGASEILTKVPESDVPQRTCAIALDTADLLRLGSCREAFEGCASSICIDHHGTNDGYAQINFIAPEAAATCEIVTYIYQAMQWPIAPDAALCLFTGLSTDTGHFNFENTTGNTLRAAALLLDIGINVSGLTRKLYRENRIEHTRLKARAVMNMQLLFDGQAALMTLEPQDFECAQAEDYDSEGIIDAGIQTKGVKIAALLRENADGVKISFRSSAPYRVDELAQRLGGGGHMRAAGATVSATMQETTERVIKAIDHMLDTQG